MSDPKEPSYFCKDLDVPLAPRSLDEYDRIFDRVRPEHIAIGEASTAYLRSVEAVRGILEYNATAKFVVCLRNPVNMVASVHNQLLKRGEETEPDLQRAWDLQRDRAAGRNLPRRQSNSERFQYGSHCALGAQVARLLATVPREQVFFSLLEDMRFDPRETYGNVLKFLGLPLDGRMQFPVHNKRRKIRSMIVSRVAYRLAEAKRRIGWRRGTGLGRSIQEWNTYTDVQSRMVNGMRITLKEYYKDDVEILSRLLRRDFSHWLS
jgi:hypothetical protein